MTNPKFYLCFSFSNASQDYKFTAIFTMKDDAEAEVARLKEIQSGSGYLIETMDEIIERLLCARLGRVADELKNLSEALRSLLVSK